MKTKKSNLTFSSVGFVASILILFYLILNDPQLPLIIVFGLIGLADTYFLVDSIVRKVDEIAELMIDKQTELVKVDKGIYSVAKREETAAMQQSHALIQQIEELKAENQRLTEQLAEQLKICTKILIKKNQENNTRDLNNSDRISKLLVQLNGSTGNTSKEVIQALEEINKTLDSAYNDNVTRMRAN